VKVNIEPLKSEELSILVNISRTTFYDTFYKQNTEEDMELFIKSAFNLEVLHAEFCDASNHFFLAKVDKEIAGYLKLSTAASAELAGEVLEISRIYVAKEKLGLGVGRALMEFAIAFAGRKSKKIIFLGVWEHNKKAILFYKKFGFRKFGEHVFMVGKDAQIDWLMKKEL
jgi:ribosomal protein S18 acetylase RimI-like enzyme